MTIYYIPYATGKPVICIGNQVTNCRTNEKQSVEWTGDNQYRMCRDPPGTGFTEPLGVAVRADP